MLDSWHFFLPPACYALLVLVDFWDTLGMGGVLGNEWSSLAGFTLLYRGTTCLSTSREGHPHHNAKNCKENLQI
jgi:hypothetical protein